MKTPLAAESSAEGAAAVFVHDVLKLVVLVPFERDHAEGVAGAAVAQEGDGAIGRARPMDTLSKLFS